jgi:tetratricopeptide (TPR) repeat protein
MYIWNYYQYIIQFSSSMKTITFYTFLFLPLLLFGQTDQLQEIKHTIDHLQYDKGLKLIGALPNKIKETPTAYYYKAICEKAKGEFDAAILSATSALKKTSKMDTLYPNILLLRALSYAYVGKTNLGVIDDELLIKEFPENIDYVIHLSYLYGENRQYYECIKLLKQVLTRDSLNINILNNLSYYNNEAKDYKASINYATKGLKLTTDSLTIASLLNNLGFAQGKTISPEKGLETINQSITYCSTNSFAYYNLGLIYLDKRDVDNMCINFKKAKQLGGNNMVADYIKYCK